VAVIIAQPFTWRLRGLELVILPLILTLQETKEVKSPRSTSRLTVNVPSALQVTGIEELKGVLQPVMSSLQSGLGFVQVSWVMTTGGAVVQAPVQPVPRSKRSGQAMPVVPLGY